MKRRDAPEVQAWAALAASDLRVAGAVFAMSPPEWHQVCFHAQQAAEKSFKALLEALQLPVPRTHDLVVLVDLLLGRHADLADLAESAAFLA